VKRNQCRAVSEMIWYRPTCAVVWVIYNLWVQILPLFPEMSPLNFWRQFYAGQLSVAVHIKTCIGTHRHIGTFFYVDHWIEYWILSCKVLYPMPAISAYSAIFLPSSVRLPYDVTQGVANQPSTSVCANVSMWTDACFICTQSLSCDTVKMLL